MLFYIHNTSRDISKRLQRALAPERAGLLQFLGSQRIVRGRPLIINEEALAKYLPELKAAVKSGRLEVKTPDGRKVDLDSLKPAAIAPPPPLPVIVPDSVVNDKPSGIPMPIYPDGAVQSVQPDDTHAPTDPGPVEEESQDMEYTDTGAGAKRGPRGRRR